MNRSFGWRPQQGGSLRSPVPLDSCLTLLQARLVSMILPFYCKSGMSVWCSSSFHEVLTFRGTLIFAPAFLAAGLYLTLGQ